MEPAARRRLPRPSSPLRRLLFAGALAGLLAGAPTASAQWVVTGAFTCGPLCDSFDWDLEELEGELYVFKLPTADLDADPDLALYQYRRGGARLGIRPTDVDPTAYQVVGGWREPVVEDVEGVFALALARGSLAFDSSLLTGFVPGAPFTFMGTSSQRPACAFPGQQGPRVVGGPIGSTVTWQPLREIDDRVPGGSGSCADAGNWRRGFVIGYNVYRLPFPAPGGDSLADFRSSGWLAFADLAALDFTVPDADGTSGSDLDSGDGLSLINPDGRPDTGDELLVFSDPAAGSFQYRIQPVVRGDPSWFDAGLTSADLAPAVRLDLDGDGFPEAIDIAPDGSPEFIDPSGRGLGLTHGGEIFSSWAAGTPENELGAPVCDRLDDTPTERDCDDGHDDDRDGLVDCADPDCADDPACADPPLRCSAGPDLFAACGRASLSGSASGGRPPYAFSWSSACDVEFRPSAEVAEPELLASPCPPGCDVLLTVTDALGARCSDEVRVEPQNRFPPELAVPDSVTVECPAPPDGAPDGRLVWLARASAEHPCGDAEVLIEQERIPGCGGTHRTEARFTAVDPCGLVSETLERTYAVVDGTPPELIAPADRVLECGAADAASVAAWLAEAAATDTCSAAEVHSRLVERVEGCGRSWTETHELWARDDCGNESSRVTRRFHASDTTPPSLNAPADLRVECPPPSEGPASLEGWLASATATDGCGSAEVVSRLVSRETGCGETWTELHELWAVDACGLESPRVRRSYTIVDTTPPSFPHSGVQFEHVLWPPDHSWRSFEVAAQARASDACGEVAVEAIGCASNQPMDAQDGDGATAADCLISVDGAAFAARAERRASCGPGSERRYLIALVARDDCGNEAEAEGLLRVPHASGGEASGRGGTRVRRAGDLPYPTRHDAVYGEGCAAP